MFTNACPCQHGERNDVAVRTANLSKVAAYEIGERSPNQGPHDLGPVVGIDKLLSKCNINVVVVVVVIYKGIPRGGSRVSTLQSVS